MKKTSQVQEKVNGYHPGDKAKIEIISEGKRKELEVVFQGSEDDLRTGGVADDGGVAFYGASLKEADSRMLSRAGIRNGVLVSSAGSGRFANAGGTDGMIIQYINGQAVSSPKDVVDQANRGKRAVYIEGIDASGRSVYFGFAKE